MRLAASSTEIKRPSAAQIRRSAPTAPIASKLRPDTVRMMANTRSSRASLKAFASGRADLVVEERVGRRLQLAGGGVHVPEQPEGEHAHHEQRHEAEDRAVREGGRHLAGVVRPPLAAPVPPPPARQAPAAPPPAP